MFMDKVALTFIKEFPQYDPVMWPFAVLFWGALAFLIVDELSNHRLTRAIRKIYKRE